MEVTSILTTISLTKITPSKMNPRKTFDEDALKELAENIKNQGLLQPITVRPTDYEETIDESIGKIVSIPIKFEIVCGERRYRAFSIANGPESEIPCIIKKMSDKEAFDAMITENLQRKDVDPVEEAFAFAQLMESGGDIDDIALRFGKSRRFVQERLKLNSLVPTLKEALTKGLISIASAMQLAKLKTALQDKFARENERYLKEESNYKMTIREINGWITRESMLLSQAIFLEYAEDDEDEKTPLETWNTTMEKCATCPMNTACATSLFYSMNGNARCTDRECFEKKSAKYIIKQIEPYADNLAKDGAVMQPGQTVILTEEGGYGYDNIKRIRQQVLDIIKERGWLVATPEMFDGKCKYYGDDERLPKLIKDYKVVRCISIGTPYRVEVEEEFYYTKGSNENVTQTDPEQEKANGLVTQYKNLLSKMNESANSELHESFRGSKYANSTTPLEEVDEYAFWAIVLSKCDSIFLNDKCHCQSVYSGGGELIEWVKQNFTEENMYLWTRQFIKNNITIPYGGSGLTNLGARVLRMLTKAHSPKTFEEISKKFADKFEKKSEKFKNQLNELGFDIQGKRLKK